MNGIDEAGMAGRPGLALAYLTDIYIKRSVFDAPHKTN